MANGPLDQGLELFSGAETIKTTLGVAYGLEQGLEEFYTIMQNKVDDQDTKNIFALLTNVEQKHQQHIISTYNSLPTNLNGPRSFEEFIKKSTIEGGITTEEYIERFEPSIKTPVDVAAMAMTIEAQAMDLYQRAANQATDKIIKNFLQQIANEEQQHLLLLGKLIDNGLNNSSN